MRLASPSATTATEETRSRSGPIGRGHSHHTLSEIDSSTRYDANRRYSDNRRYRPRISRTEANAFRSTRNTHSEWRIGSTSERTFPRVVIELYETRQALTEKHRNRLRSAQLSYDHRSATGSRRTYRFSAKHSDGPETSIRTNAPSDPKR